MPRRQVIFEKFKDGEVPNALSKFNEVGEFSKTRLPLPELVPYADVAH